MAERVQMPQLGATMVEGRLVRWLASEGQQVGRGEPIAEIETDKIVAQVEAPADGVLIQTVAKPDDVVRVTGLLGWIAAPGEEPPTEVVAEPPSLPVADESTPVPRVSQPVLPTGVEGRVRASPRARRLAEENGVDLRQISGSGPGGRITGLDVQAHVEALSDTHAVRPARTTTQRLVPLSESRGHAVERTVETAQAAAVTLFSSADATELARLRDQVSEVLKSPVGYDGFLVMIAARALADHPYMNARLTDSGIEQLAEISVGYAIATESGTFVPVIRDAGSKSLDEIISEIQTLALRAQKGGLTLDDMTGGTFTIANLDMHGTEHFTPIIDLGQCAVLGVGEVGSQPAVVDDGIEAHWVMALSLTFDHRVVDGAPSARFLQRIVQLVEEPRLLLI